MVKLEELETKETPSVVYAADGVVYLSGKEFKPFEDYSGPLNVAVNDSLQEIVVGAGKGGGPRVTVFNASNLTVEANFYVYEPSFLGGVNVAVDAQNNELVVGSGEGGGPIVVKYDINSWVEKSREYIGDPNSRTGVDVSSITSFAQSDLTLGSGKNLIYVDFNGKYSQSEQKEIVKKVWGYYSEVQDLLTFTTVMPNKISPRDYLTVNITNSLGFAPGDAAGFAPVVLGDKNEKSDYQPNVIYARAISFDSESNLIAHEIGHYFGLTHVNSAVNIMKPMASSGNLTFDGGQLLLMKYILTYRTK